MNHTPGPWWHAATYGDLYAAGAYDRELTRPISKADARLIAAAPELLACVLDVLDADGNLDAMDFDRYRAAIKKATGEA